MARPKSEDKKQALLEAATAAFAQSGIAAPRRRPSPAAPVWPRERCFRYFATKDELLNELYLAIKLRPVRTNDRRAGSGRSAEENARAISGTAIYRLGRAQPDGATKRSAGWRSASASPTKPAARVKESFPELNENNYQLSVKRYSLSEGVPRLWRRPVCRWRNHHRIRQPRSQRAGEIIALGFEAMWHALHEADA